MKIKCLPQSLEAQLIESILGPTQIAPPFEGGGLSQPLLLVLLHTLFVRMHPPSGLHSPHAPLTSHEICIFDFNSMMYCSLLLYHNFEYWARMLRTGTGVIIASLRFRR